MIIRYIIVFVILTTTITPIGWSIFSSIKSGATGFGKLIFSRREQPLMFWLLVSMRSVSLVLFGLIFLGFCIELAANAFHW